MRAHWIVCGLLIALPALGAAQELKPETRAGYDLFRSLIGESGLKPLADFESLTQNPSDAVLISLGDPGWLRRMPEGFLRDFIRQGGSLLIATDHDLNNAVWRPELAVLAGAWVEEPAIVCLHQEYCYEGKPELPILVPAPTNQGGPPLLYSLLDERRVAVSLPSRLRIAPPNFLGLGGGLQGGVKPIAYLPEHCTRQRDWNRDRGFFQPIPDAERLLGVAGQRYQGKLVLLADHHLFMNDLMVREDLQNYEFTTATLDYLRDGPERGRKRAHCLLLENGRVETDFTPAIGDLTELPWAAILREANKIEAGLGAIDKQGEFSNLFWKLLARYNIYPRGLTLAILGWLTVLAALYLVYRLLQARAPHEAALPRVGRSLEKQVPTTRLLAQRRDELLEHGRLYEPARHLARTLFEELGLTGGLPVPPVRLAGSWWQRWVGLARFHRLWMLAFGERPVPVSAREWPRFLRDVEAIRQGFLEGSIQLVSVPIA